jgi:hypothetical protein
MAFSITLTDAEWALVADLFRGAEVSVDNFGTYARVATLVAQRWRSETYESPPLPLSYSATPNKITERDDRRQPPPMQHTTIE